jgi:hypothetical protein
VAGIPNLDFDEVEVVEQPLRRWGDELATVHIVGEEAIRLAQHAGVVFQAGEEWADFAARIPSQREAGREGSGPFLQPLDAQELGTKGLFGGRAATAPEKTEQGPQGVLDSIRQEFEVVPLDVTPTK